jgi:hypothetical protein
MEIIRILRTRKNFACLRHSNLALSHVSGVSVISKTGFGFDDRIYWAFIQLVSTVHKSLTHCHIHPAGHSTAIFPTLNRTDFIDKVSLGLAFNSNQFVLASSPLRHTTRELFIQLNLWVNCP